MAFVNMPGYSSNLALSNLAVTDPPIRNHLPTQFEVNQSLQLIKQWKAQVATLTNQINANEEAQRIQQAELERLCEEQVQSLRQQLAVDTQILADTTSLQTNPIRLQLETVEKWLKIEQAFVSGIRRIPEEILVEIFKLYLQGDIPSRGLALVSKEWRAILLDTPSLWTTIKVQFTRNDKPDPKIDMLQKRIKLSRSALLDVTISLENYNSGYKGIESFDLVAGIDVGRWRSLRLEAQTTEWFGEAPTLALRLKGRFDELRTLYMHLPRPSTHTKFLSIFQKIASDRPNLEGLDLHGELPTPLRGASIFRNVKKLKSDVQHINELYPLGHLEELDVRGYTLDEPFNFSRFPPLPEQTNWEPSITKIQFSMLQLSMVQSLVIPRIDHCDFTGAIQLPVLRDLNITCGDLRSIECLCAPGLVKLSLRTSSNGSMRGRNTTKMTSIIKANPSTILVDPTSVHLDLALGPTAINALLERWTQVEHLSIVYGKEFPWKNSFATALMKGTLMPNLLDLKLEWESHKPAAEADWKAVAKNILLHRRQTAFKSIEWRARCGEWEKVNA